MRLNVSAKVTIFIDNNNYLSIEKCCYGTKKQAGDFHQWSLPPI